MFGQNLLDLAVKLVRNEGNLQGQARRGPSLAGVLLLFPLPPFLSLVSIMLFFQLLISLALDTRLQLGF